MAPNKNIEEIRDLSCTKKLEFVYSNMLPEWLLLAALGTFLYACVTFVDKYVVEKVVSDSRGLVGISSIIAILVAICALPFLPYSIGLKDSFLLFTSGALIVISLYIYFHVITRDHVSFVTIFFQIVPIFVIIFANLLLGEILTYTQVIGAFLIIIAGLAMAFADQTTKEFKWSFSKKTILWMLIYDMLWALAAICIKLTSESVSLGHLVVYESVGMGVLGLSITLLVKNFRNALVHTVTRIPKRYILVLIFNEGLLYLTAKLSMNYAYMLGSAGPVSLVESSQILMALILGFILSSIWPKIFKENTNKLAIKKKLIYGLFMIFGLSLLR